MIGAAFILPLLGGEAGVETITTGYSYRRRYVIPAEVHRLTPTDASVEFPVLITALWLRSVANGGKVQSASGHDIRFESDNGVKLPFELAAYDPVAGRVEAWLRLQPPGPDVALTFTMLYGNPDQATPEANPTAVWPNYVASWDMASGVDSGPQAAHLELVDMTATTLMGMDAAALLTPEPDLAVTPSMWLANPFNSLSPQHRPIGTGATYTAITQSLSRITGAGFNSNNGGGTNVYMIQPGDPVRTVTSDGSVGGNTRLPVDVQVPQSAAIGGAVSDRTIIFFDPNTYICHQFYHWGTSVTSPTAGRYVSWDIRDLGLNVGTSASKKAALIGLNRGVELSTPGTVLRHVNECTVNRFGDTAVLSRTVIWPAYGKDSTADDGDNNLGELPYGALLAVPPPSKGGPTKSSLGLTELGGRLYDQVMGFGIYLFDGGPTNMVFRCDQFATSGPLQTEFKDEMEKLIPHLKWISNNAADQTASGGGTPIATGAPLG